MPHKPASAATDADGLSPFFSVGKIHGLNDMALIDDLISMFGKRFDSQEVKQALDANELYVAFDAPPDIYAGSRKKGVSVFFEADVAINVQLLVRPIPGPEPYNYAPYSGSLPFGIERDMGQEQVHRLLGKPVLFDKGRRSWYLVCDRKLVLIVDYGTKSNLVTTVLISIRSSIDDIDRLLERES